MPTGCVICGSKETVKAHLFPRALALDIRGSAPNLVEGSKARDGYVLRQNGLWDPDFLCLEHERKSGEGEKYAIELIRTAPSRLIARTDLGYELPNPKPHLLSHFIHSTVWKFAESKYGREHGLSLGPYEPKLRDRVFSAAPCELPFVVARHRLHLSGEPLNFGLPPHRQKLGKWRTWMFVIGGLQFHLKTDQQPFPKAFEPYLGNGNDPLILTSGPEEDIRDVPLLRPVFERMKRR